jgi:hypothetical protein
MKKGDPKPKSASEKTFLDCVSEIEQAVGTEIDLDQIGSISPTNIPDPLNSAFFKLFLKKKDFVASIDRLQKPVSVKMTLMDAISLALDLEELSTLREFRNRLGAAAKAYYVSTDRQEKRLAKFANDAGLTDGRRHAKLNEFDIFTDYLQAINGIECEKLSKQEALVMVQKKHGINSPEAVISHLKRYIKKSKEKYPGILP